MKYENMNWLVEAYLGNGDEEFCDFINGYDTLAKAAADMGDLLDKNPDLDVRLIFVTETMRDDWRIAELEHADQRLLDYAL